MNKPVLVCGTGTCVHQLRGTVQLVVNQPQKPTLGRFVALTNCIEKLGNLARALGGDSSAPTAPSAGFDARVVSHKSTRLSSRA